MIRGARFLILTAALGSGVLVGCLSEVPRSTAAILPPERPTSTVTPTVFHTETPRPSPTPSPTLDTAAFVATSLALRESEEYEKDIVLWDVYLSKDPSFADGYYQRATSLNWGAPGVGGLDRYLRYNLAAFADLDRAIELGLAADGRYYWRRYQVLTDLIAVEPSRTNREALMKLAFDNLVAANSIGPWSDVSRGVEVSALADLGRCEEAIATGWHHLQELERLFPTQPWGHARAHAQLGRAYNCAGRWADAIQHYDQALALDPDIDHWTWEFWRSVNLYFLGRLEQAQEFLDRDIEAHPNYSGERYFLRALILYDQDRVDEALADLQFGAFQTWGPYGVYSYVHGRIMIDNGDVEGGLDLLRQAEATLLLEYAPLLERVRLEIHQAEANASQDSGAEDLVDPSQPSFESLASGTPMPALTPAPTPRYPFEIAGLCGCDWRLFDLGQGTGPLLIRSELELDSLFTYIYRFQPPTPIRAGSAVDLTYRIIPFGEVPTQDPTIRIEFYSQDSRVIPGTGSWGDNRVHDLSAVGRGGEVTMVIRNVGVLPVYIQDLGIRLVSRNSQGGYLIQEAAGLPYIKEDPVPPPNMVLGLDEPTDALSLSPGSGPTIRFSPEEPLDYALVTELTVFVEPMATGDGLPLFAMLWSAWGGGWQYPEQVSRGVFRVQWANLAVDLRGDIVLALLNQGTEVLELANVSLRLVIQDPEGIEHVLGSRPK